MLALVEMAARKPGKKGADRAQLDAEPVASAADIPREEPSRAGRNISGWISASGSIASVVISVVALARVYSSDASTTASAISGLRRDLDIVLTWIRYRDPTFPGAKAVVTPEPEPGPHPSAAPSPDQIAPESTLAKAPRLAPPPRPPNGTFPEDVPTVHPQRCISRQTRKPVTCTPELACRPAGKVYAPDFRKQVISEQAGLEVTADTLVCEP